ncbi:MAG: aspartate/glutamate racemase family protein [Acetobacteraceae bacterium]
MNSCCPTVTARTGRDRGPQAPPGCLGIVGGLGPMATARLYLDICQRVHAASGVTPAIMIDSVRMPRAIEESFITAIPSPESERLLCAGIRAAVGRLVAAGASVICAACNTVQPLFMAEAVRSGVAAIGMAEAALGAVHRGGYRSALVLASSSTRRMDVYGAAARALGISLAYPEPVDQATIFRAILSSTHHRATGEVTPTLACVCRRYEGVVDCVLLGCTDLSQIGDQALGRLPVIDSLAELGIAAAGFLLNCA